jgi:hypothetical protein
MIKVDLPNIITIALAGALGYALFAGFNMLKGKLTGGAVPTAGA